MLLEELKSGVGFVYHAGCDFELVAEVAVEEGDKLVHGLVHLVCVDVGEAVDGEQDGGGGLRDLAPLRLPPRPPAGADLAARGLYRLAHVRRFALRGAEGDKRVALLGQPHVQTFLNGA